MLEQYSIAKARNHFTSLVRAVERESAIELTRRGLNRRQLWPLPAPDARRLSQRPIGYTNRYFGERGGHQHALPAIRKGRHPRDLTLGCSKRMERRFVIQCALSAPCSLRPDRPGICLLIYDHRCTQT